MDLYQLTTGTTIIRISDKACIPADYENSDYIEYLEWLSNGNTPKPIPIKTKEEKLSDLKAIYQPQLDLLKDNMLAAMGMDGTVESTKKQAISDQYKTISAQYTAERKLIV